MSKPIHITKERLVNLIEAEIRRLSGGVAPVKITSVDGFVRSGEAFEIEGIVLHVAAPKPKDFSNYTAPAGHGKIKLAAIDGETV